MRNSDLRNRAESIGRLMDERDEKNADIKAAIDAAKSVGFNPTALRQAVKIARMDAKKRAIHETGQKDLIQYLFELEGKPALREVA